MPPRFSIGLKKWPHPDLIQDFISCWNKRMHAERMASRFGVRVETIQSRVSGLRAKGHVLIQRDVEGSDPKEADKRYQLHTRDATDHKKARWKQGKFIPPKANHIPYPIVDK